MIKKISIPIIVVVAFICLAIHFTKKRPQKIIAIVSIVRIDAITQLEDGFRKRIIESDFAKKDSISWFYANAQNDASEQNLIVDRIINTIKPNLIYVLGTPIANAIQKRDPGIIIVQGAVTDPVEAGLAKSWDSSGKNYAATTDLPPIDKQISLIKQLIPNVRSIGIIYNTSEVNSVSVVKRIRKYIDNNKLKLMLEERSIANTSEVSTATESLNGKVDAIYIPPDNTVHAALQVVCKVAYDEKIPVFTTVESSLTDGAFVAFSLNYYKLGEESADIALMILEHKAKASSIPIKPTDNAKIIINSKIATYLNIDLTAVKGQPNIEIK